MCSEAVRFWVSVRATAKPECRQRTRSRAQRREWKDRVLTQGDPRAERLGEVSRGHSSDEAWRKSGRAKGRRTKRQSSVRSWTNHDKSL